MLPAIKSSHSSQQRSTSSLDYHIQPARQGWGRSPLTKSNVKRQNDNGRLGMPRSMSVDLGMFGLPENEAEQEPPTRRAHGPSLSHQIQTWRGDDLETNLLQNLSHLEQFVQGALTYQDAVRHNNRDFVRQHKSALQRKKPMLSTNMASSSRSPSPMRLGEAMDASCGMRKQNLMLTRSPPKEAVEDKKGGDIFSKRSLSRAAGAAPGEAAAGAAVGGLLKPRNRAEEIEKLSRDLAMTRVPSPPASPTNSHSAEAAVGGRAVIDTPERNQPAQTNRKGARASFFEPPALPSASLQRSPRQEFGEMMPAALKSGPARLMARSDSLSPLRDRREAKAGASPRRSIPIFAASPGPTLLAPLLGEETLPTHACPSKKHMDLQGSPLASPSPIPLSVIQRTPSYGRYLQDTKQAYLGDIRCAFAQSDEYLHGRVSGTSVVFADKAACTGAKNSCRCIYCEYFRDNQPKVEKKGFLKKTQNDVLTSAQLESRRRAERAALFANMSASEKAALLARMSDKEKGELLAGLDSWEQAAMLASMDAQERMKLLASLSNKEKAAMLASMTAQDKQALLASMSPEERAAFLASLGEKERAALLGSMSDDDKAAMFARMSAKERAAMLSSMCEADRAALLASLSEEERAAVLSTMSGKARGAVLAGMSSGDREALLGSMSDSDKAAMLAQMSLKDKAALLGGLSMEQRAQMLGCMSDHDKAALLASLDPEQRAAMLAAMSDSDKAKVLSTMSAADRVAALSRMSAEERAAMLAAMSEEERAAFLASMSEAELEALMSGMCDSTASKFFNSLSTAAKQALMTSMRHCDRAALLASMSPAEREAFLATLSEAEQAAMLAALTPEERETFLASLSEEHREAFLQAAQRAEQLKEREAMLAAMTDEERTAFLKQEEDEARQHEEMLIKKKQEEERRRKRKEEEAKLSSEQRAFQKQWNKIKGAALIARMLPHSDPVYSTPENMKITLENITI